MAYDESYGQMEKQAAQLNAGAMGRYIPPTDRNKLLEKQAVLQQELARVNTALEMLDAHPDLEEFTKVLQAALR